LKKYLLPESSTVSLLHWKGTAKAREIAAKATTTPTKLFISTKTSTTSKAKNKTITTECKR